MIRTFESTPPADNLVAWQLEVQEGEDWRVICAGPLTRSITGSIPDDAKLVRIRWGVKGGGPLLDGDVLPVDAKTPGRALTLMVTTQPTQPQAGGAFTITARVIGKGKVDDLPLAVDWMDAEVSMTSLGGGRYQAVLLATEPGRYSPDVRCVDPVARTSITFDVLP